jgi:hypothetical protein
MKFLLALVLLLGSAFSVTPSVTISPNYVRAVVGANQTLEIRMVGEGKLYELNLFGSYLSWQTKKVWVGPGGKTDRVVFSPAEPGDYIITASFANRTFDLTAVVFEPASADLLQQVQSLKKRASGEALEILEKAEGYCTEGKLELCEMELDKLGTLEENQRNFLEGVPMFLIVVVLIGVSFFLVKGLL